MDLTRSVWLKVKTDVVLIVEWYSILSCSSFPGIAGQKNFKAREMSLQAALQNGQERPTLHPEGRRVFLLRPSLSNA
jgi:hypothetical protein